MGFDLPSAASRGVVSILNGPEGEQDTTPAPPPAPPPKSSGRSPSSSVSSDASSASRPPVPRIAVQGSAPHGSLLPSLDSGSSSSSSSNGRSLAGSSMWSSGPSSSMSSANTSVEPSPQAQEVPYYHPKSQTGAEGEKVLNHPGFAASPAPMHESDRTYFPPYDGSADGSYKQEDDEMSDARGPPSEMLRMRAPSMASSDFPDGSVCSASSSTKPKPSIVHGKKRYPCSHPGCDKTFSTSGHAARHNRIHTGQKPYRCTFPGCKASFSRQDNALAHFRTGHALAKPRSGLEDDDPPGDMPAGQGQFDAQVEAGAELGRKALEDGTAIAIVRDGKVQRTVGLPRARRPTVSGRSDDGMGPDERRHSISGGRVGPTPAAEYAQSRAVAGNEGPSGPLPDYKLRAPATASQPSSGPRMHPYAIPPPYHQRALAPGIWDAVSVPRHASSLGGRGLDDASSVGAESAFGPHRRLSSTSSVQPYATASEGGGAPHRRNSSYNGSPPSPLYSGSIQTPMYSASSTGGRYMSGAGHWQGRHLDSNVRARKPSWPTALSQERGMSPSSSGDSRSRQSSSVSPPATQALPPYFQAGVVSSHSPSPLYLKHTLHSLPCSSDRSTSRLSASTSAMDISDAPIVLPPLKLREPARSR